MISWEEKIRNNINEGVFPPQKDWNEFSLKYRRFKVIKRLKYTSVAVMTILVLGLVGYHFTQQDINNKDEVVSKIQIVESVVADNQIVNGDSQTLSSDNVEKDSANEIKSNNNNNNTVNKINNKQDETPIADTENNIGNDNNNDDIVVDLPKEVEKMISADFMADNVQGCGTLTVQFSPKEICDGAIYLWEFGDGTFSNKITPEHQYTTGKFSVSLTTKYFNSNKQNQRLKKDFITVLAKPKAKFLFDKTSTKNIQIHNSSIGFEQCQWLVDSVVTSTDFSPVFPLNEGYHSITLILNNQGCKDTLTKIATINKEIKIYLPTAFTPNGDGQNDEFKPVFSYLPDSYKLLIFDNWGKIVFSSTDVNRGWDGKFNGQEPKEGIYLWKIIYQQKNNKPMEKSGQVKLFLK